METANNIGRCEPLIMDNLRPTSNIFDGPTVERHTPNGKLKFKGKEPVVIVITFLFVFAVLSVYGTICLRYNHKEIKQIDFIHKPKQTCQYEETEQWGNLTGHLCFMSNWHQRLTLHLNNNSLTWNFEDLRLIRRMFYLCLVNGALCRRLPNHKKVTHLPTEKGCAYNLHFADFFTLCMSSANFMLGGTILGDNVSAYELYRLYEFLLW